jgi:hypothetical protein
MDDVEDLRVERTRIVAWVRDGVAELPKLPDVVP